MGSQLNVSAFPAGEHCNGAALKPMPNSHFHFHQPCSNKVSNSCTITIAKGEDEYDPGQYCFIHSVFFLREALYRFLNGQRGKVRYF
jgi:hypothetical protein